MVVATTAMHWQRRTDFSPFDSDQEFQRKLNAEPISVWVTEIKATRKRLNQENEGLLEFLNTLESVIIKMMRDEDYNEVKINMYRNKMEEVREEITPADWERPGFFSPHDSDEEFKRKLDNIPTHKLVRFIKKEHVQHGTRGQTLLEFLDLFEEKRMVEMRSEGYNEVKRNVLRNKIQEVREEIKTEQKQDEKTTVITPKEVRQNTRPYPVGLVVGCVVGGIVFVGLVAVAINLHKKNGGC